MKVTVLAVVLAMTLFAPPSYLLITLFAGAMLVSQYTLSLPGIIMSRSGRVDRFFFYIVLCFIYVIVVLISIFINQRLFVFQDYAELLVIYRFIGLLYLSYCVSKDRELFDKFQKVLFIILAIYIALCFLQVLDYYFINKFGGLYSIYTPVHHMEASETLRQRFEANRFTGLSGNPSAYASTLLGILFLILIFSTKKLLYIFFAIAIVLLLVLSQARTAFIALIFLSLFLLVSYKGSYRSKIAYLVILATFAIALSVATLVFNLTFIYSLFSVSLFEQESFLVRMAVWGRLLLMFLDKPLFGHAPSKDFFSLENIHVDSQYILILWSYGIFGLIIFLAISFYPMLIRKYSCDKCNRLRLLFFGHSLVVAVISFSSVVLTDNNISVLYAMFVGSFFGRIFYLNRR